MGPEGWGRASHRPASWSRRRGPGGYRIGPAVEIRMLHRREGRAIDDGDGGAALGEAAGEGSADRAGADDADIELGVRFHRDGLLAWCWCPRFRQNGRFG